MPELDEKELKKHIKDGVFSHVYFIYGSEDYLKKHYVNSIASKAVSKDFEDFNLHKFDGKIPDLQEFRDITQTVPMFSEYRCTIVRDLPIEKMSKQDYEDFCDILENVQDGSIVIIWTDSIEDDARKSAKWKSIVQYMKKIGIVAELDKMDSSSIVRLICSGAKKRGCEISPDVAMYLLSTVGNDLNNLLNELDKLCSYVGDREIKKADVNEVAVRSVEANVYDLSKSLLAGNSERAFKILNNVLSQKVEPVIILGTIIMAFVDMYRAKVAVAGGERPDYAAKLFNYRGREFRLRNAARDASGLSITTLRACLDELDGADRLLKGSSLDPRIVLEQCMTRLMLISSR
ncbi:MAG: DNA polymerase III subunit delta [Clostridiales bacterium]|nr:DNA polymerase III subunit delta [Clostridiales bacterium]